MQRFEYLNVTAVMDEKENNFKVHYNNEVYATNSINELLNSLGIQGWELVSVVALTASEKPWLLELSMTYTSGFIYYFKRLLTGEALEIAMQELEQEEEIINAEKNLIDTYLSQGYQIVFEHKDRLIFGKGPIEVRFDFDKNTNQWVEKK